MSLDIGDAVSDAFDRTIQKTGLMMAGLFFIVGFVNTVLGQTLTKSLGTTAYSSQGVNTALALPLSPAVTGLIWIPVAIFSAAVGILAFRVFTHSETDKIPTEFYHRKMPWAILNVILGGIAFGLMILVLLLLPAIPGIVVGALGARIVGMLLAVLGFLLAIPVLLYIAVSLYLWNVYVAVEDQNFMDAFRNSWETVEGQRLQVFGILVILFVIGAVAGAVGEIPTLAGLKAVGTVTGQIGTALASAFSAAVTSQIYLQLKEEESEEGEE